MGTKHNIYTKTCKHVEKLVLYPQNSLFFAYFFGKYGQDPRNRSNHGVTLHGRYSEKLSTMTFFFSNPIKDQGGK